MRGGSAENLRLAAIVVTSSRRTRAARLENSWLLGALGEIDGAFAVLARAEEEHQDLLYYTGMPGFDSLRADARFTALLRRLELSPA
jgi:hypothetical protein